MQKRIEFFRDLQLRKPPTDAPGKIVRQVESPRMAMRTTLKAQGLKLLCVSRVLKISEGYLSKLVNEREPMPEWFPAAFAYATGSNLLRQFLALSEALNEKADTERWLERKLAAELREVA
jgi:hypothetical protein